MPHVPGLDDTIADPAAPASDATAPADRSPIAPASIDKYQLIRELGSGGMGRVWLARDTVLDREVAIKVVKSGTREPASRQRLLREARSAAKLSHPNVVSVYHVLELEGQIHIVMELLGRSLADELSDKSHLPWSEATAAIRDAAAGLSAAHALGLVHRDIKPSNLLRSGQGGIKVADFGLVDSPDSPKLTATGAVLGTPGYMAPEQWRGEKADCRSNVYALGCTYYHLLTGRPPFAAADRHEAVDGRAIQPFPDPRRLCPGPARRRLPRHRDGMPKQSGASLSDGCGDAGGARSGPGAGRSPAPGVGRQPEGPHFHLLARRRGRGAGRGQQPGSADLR